MNTNINVIYLGGPTVILELDGFRIMTDPTLDPAGTTFMINGKPGYWKSEGPALTDIGKIDLVLLSHDQHGDNLDNAGRELLKTVPLTLTTVVGAERLQGERAERLQGGAVGAERLQGEKAERLQGEAVGAEQLQGNTKGLRPWEKISLRTPAGEEIVITSTPARHGPAGSEKLTGDVTGFIVSYGNKQLYLTGDTVFYEGMAEVAKRFDPQYVFIFAGAAQPRGPFNVTMDTNDALDTASAFPAATLIPVHFEGWSHYTETAEMLEKAFAALGIRDRLLVLAPGKNTAL